MVLHRVKLVLRHDATMYLRLFVNGCVCVYEFHMHRDTDVDKSVCVCSICSAIAHFTHAALLAVRGAPECPESGTLRFRIRK